jgi:hypothetical protein
MEERGRAGVGLVLGLARMAGATVGAWLLLRTGVSNWTVGVVGATGLLTLASRRWPGNARMPAGPAGPPG